MISSCSGMDEESMSRVAGTGDVRESIARSLRQRTRVFQRRAMCDGVVVVEQQSTVLCLRVSLPPAFIGVIMGICRCVNGHSGRFCEIGAEELVDAESAGGAWVLLLLLFLFSTLIAVFLLYKRRPDIM